MESLEKIFQQVEEDNERRVQDEASQPGRQLDVADDSSEPGSSEASLRVRARRRGSVSVSRFGQLSDTLTQLDDEPRVKVHNGPRRTGSSLAPYSPSLPNHSADSLASDNLSDDDDAHTDEHHTQMQEIVGRRNTLSRAMGGLLSPRLTRDRSASVLTQNNLNANMVIGVSVVEATTEHAPGDDDTPSTVIHVLRTQRSAPSLSPKDSLLTRALGFTKKFRRRSRGVSSPSSPAGPSSSPLPPAT